MLPDRKHETLYHNMHVQYAECMQGAANKSTLIKNNVYSTLFSLTVRQVPLQSANVTLADIVSFAFILHFFSQMIISTRDFCNRIVAVSGWLWETIMAVSSAMFPVTMLVAFSRADVNI